MDKHTVENTEFIQCFAGFIEARTANRSRESQSSERRKTREYLRLQKEPWRQCFSCERRDAETFGSQTGHSPVKIAALLRKKTGENATATI
jgi:hypothetical protein